MFNRTVTTYDDGRASVTTYTLHLNETTFLSIDNYHGADGTHHTLFFFVVRTYGHQTSSLLALKITRDQAASVLAQMRRIA